MSRIRSALLAFCIATVTSVGAAANDKELRALTIPASACVEEYVTPVDFRAGYWQTEAAPNESIRPYIYCPLPLSNIKVNGTTAPKISKFRVSYLDSDGNLDGPRLIVSLVRYQVLADGNLSEIAICTFDSNTDGGPGVKYQRSTKLCDATLQADRLYQFRITLYAGTPFGYTRVRFLGIDFPA